MDMSEFATMALEWEKAQRKADELAAVLEAATLELGKTQTVGNVRVTFSNPRKKYDYREAAEGHPMVSDATISLFSTVPDPVIDWRGICKHAGIDDIPFTLNGEPSARIKLLA